MGTNVFPKIPRPKCLPGKRYGSFARYDKDGRELIYIGLDNIAMHRDIIEQFEDEFDKAFGLDEQTEDRK